MRALDSSLPQIQRTWGDLSLGSIRSLALVSWWFGVRSMAERGSCMVWVSVWMLNPDGPSGQCRDFASKQKF